MTSDWLPDRYLFGWVLLGSTQRIRSVNSRLQRRGRRRCRADIECCYDVTRRTLDINQNAVADQNKQKFANDGIRDYSFLVTLRYIESLLLLFSLPGIIVSSPSPAPPQVTLILLLTTRVTTIGARILKERTEVIVL